MQKIVISNNPTSSSLLNGIIVLSILLGGTFASVADNIGTEGAAFLKIDAATRPSAMGGAFVGVADDVNSVFWNPAGLVQTEKKELTAMYNNWLAGIRYASSAYSQRLSENAAFGASIQGLWSEIERRTEDTEEPDSIFNAYSYAVGLSGSYALLPKIFSLGGTVKIISQDLDIDRSSGAAADAGCLIRVGGLSLGASAQNIKLQTSDGSNLPLVFRAGGAYQFARESVIAAEFFKPSAGSASYHIGMEKWLRGVLAVRVGYCIGSDDNPKNGLSAGFGLRAYGTKPLEAMNFQLDYAYVPAPDWGGMGDAHRISMIVRF